MRPIPPLGTPLALYPHRLTGHLLAKRALATYAHTGQKGPAPLAKKRGGLATYGQRGLPFGASLPTPTDWGATH